MYNIMLRARHPEKLQASKDCSRDGSRSHKASAMSSLVGDSQQSIGSCCVMGLNKSGSNHIRACVYHASNHPHHYDVPCVYMPPFRSALGITSAHPGCIGNAST